MKEKLLRRKFLNKQDTKRLLRDKPIRIRIKNTVKQMKENMREQKHGGNIFQ